MRVEHADALWREAPMTLPWLQVKDASAGPSPSGGVLQASEVSFAGRLLQRVSVGWRQDRSEARIGLGGTDPSSAPVRGVLRGGTPMTARIEWNPAPVHELVAPLGLGIPVRGVQAEGWVELDGIVFGDRTVIDTRLSLGQDLQRLELHDTHVVAGAFALQGNGQVQRSEQHALIGLKLSGSIPCTALARSAAVGRLGGMVGGMLGDVAKRTLTGAITVSVTIDADSRDLAGAKVKDSLGGACTVRLF